MDVGEAVGLLGVAGLGGADGEEGAAWKAKVFFGDGPAAVSDVVGGVA